MAPPLDLKTTFRWFTASGDRVPSWFTLLNRPDQVVEYAVKIGVSLIAELTPKLTGGGLRACWHNRFIPLLERIELRDRHYCIRAATRKKKACRYGLRCARKNFYRMGDLVGRYPQVLEELRNRSASIVRMLSSRLLR
jgi:hypothetical protein